jgi:hypothetical protein
VIRHIVVAAFVVAAARPAAAQTPPKAPSPSIGFLSGMLFRVGAEHLSGDDQRFIWDANFGADLDLVDYGAGRLTFVANYQVILGDEFHAFDANQGNYILAGAASVRAAGYELAGVFHHESRHLSDRPKRAPVDWNMAGGRVSRAFVRGETHIETRADLRGVVQKSFVDYTWEFDSAVRARVPLAPRVAAVAAGGFRLRGVDGTVDRGTQTGFRAEAGVRVQGLAGAAELFLAAERRIDPYPLQLSTATWVTAGFRLSTP